MTPVSTLVTYIYCGYLLHTFRAITCSSFYSWRSSKLIENRALIFLAGTLRWDCPWLCSTSGMFALTLSAELCGLELYFFSTEGPNKYIFQIVKCFSLCDFCLGSLRGLSCYFLNPTLYFLFVIWELSQYIEWFFCVFEMSFCVM